MLRTRIVSDRPGHPGTERAHAADQQVDRDACSAMRGRARRCSSRSTRLLSLARIPAGRPRAAFSASLRIRAVRPVAQGVGGDEQVGVAAVLGVAGEVVEEVGDVCADRRVGREQPEVLVDARGLVVVVAGPDVHVAAEDGVAFGPHDERELAVRLETDQAVDDVAAGLLELAGPADVGLLVEARLDLDDDQHLLAGAGGVHQRVDDRRVAAGPVESELDRLGRRVGGRLLDEAPGPWCRTSRRGGGPARRRGACAAKMSGLPSLGAQRRRRLRHQLRGSAGRAGPGRRSSTARPGRAGRAGGRPRSR